MKLDIKVQNSIFSPYDIKERVNEMADKRKREKTRNSLSGAQEVTYSRAFKMADRAGGYINSKSSH